MITRLIWLYRYHRFIRKWGDYPIAEIYQNGEYFKSLYKLFTAIPTPDSSSLMVPDRWIKTCHMNVELFSRKLDQVINDTKHRRLMNQPKFNIVDKKLRDFLISVDGRPAIYGSTMETLGRQLNRLYQEVEAVEINSRDYYYIQLKELFICGISLCLSYLDEYAS
jgi:hypothetical protein